MDEQEQQEEKLLLLKFFRRIRLPSDSLSKIDKDKRKRIVEYMGKFDSRMKKLEDITSGRAMFL